MSARMPGAGCGPLVMRSCAWCETVHPENLSVPWLHGDYLYFCSDTCLRERGEAG